MDDATFKACLKDADSVGSYEDFVHWKQDFLTGFRQYLDPVGTATAREADEALYFELEKLARSCLTTKNLVKEGKISPDHTSVGGQRALSEMTETMKVADQSIDVFVPKTKMQAKKCGYTKFELAAVLVKDGFRIYSLMCATRDYVAGLVTEGGALSEVLKSNQLTIVMYYFTRLETFDELMRDLGMYQLMETVEEIYKVRPRGKKKRFDKNSGRHALSDSEFEKEEPIELINDGRMFENRHAQDKDKNFRAIIDKGWSVGFAPGEEVKAPKTGKKKKKKKKASGNKTDSDDNDEDGKGGKNGASKSKKKSRSSSSPGVNDDPSGDGDDDENTRTTDDDEEDEDSSDSSDSDDEDYIYYFDPVQQIVGKLSRDACKDRGLLLSVKGGKEVFEGAVENWETEKGATVEEDIPGKMDLIRTMKEALRVKA